MPLEMGTKVRMKEVLHLVHEGPVNHKSVVCLVVSQLSHPFTVDAGLCCVTDRSFPDSVSSFLSPL